MPTMTRNLLAIATLAAGLALPGIAGAEPVLRENVTINTGIVTVGDMFDNAGPRAGDGLFRAPQPGTTGTVTLEQIAAATRAIGLSDYDTGALGAVAVTREGVRVERAMLEEQIAADLAERGILDERMTMELSLDAPVPELYAAASETPVSLSILRYRPGSGRLNARFEIAAAPAPLEISGDIQLSIEAPHTAANLSAGAIVGAGDIEMRPVPLAYAEAGGLATPDQLVGKQIQRATRSGVMLRPASVADPELIARNAMVTVVYRTGALTLTTRGQALNAASAQEPVQVLNASTRKVLRGVAAPDGTVVVSNGPQDVAGL